jgi:hypothetical protein
VSLVSFVLIGATSARAELVFFADGRNMSVKAHRTDGGSMVLTLRNGGEIVCDAALVSRIEEDEIPYPEQRPEPAVEAAVDIVAGRGGPLQADVSLQSNPRYDPLIQQAAARHGVDVVLVRAVIQVESNYESRARSA